MTPEDKKSVERICALFLKTKGAKEATYDEFGCSFRVVYPNQELAQQAKSKLSERGWDGEIYPTWENEERDPNKDYQLTLWVLEAETA